MPKTSTPHEQAVQAAPPPRVADQRDSPGHAGQTPLRLDTWSGYGTEADHRGIRRLYNNDRLPMPRALFVGPQWRRQVRVGFVDALDGRALRFTFESEIRERICAPCSDVDQIRPGVVAEWRDPDDRVSADVCVDIRRQVSGPVK